MDWLTYRYAFTFITTFVLGGQLESATQDNPQIADSASCIAPPGTSFLAAPEGDNYYRQIVTITTPFVYTFRVFAQSYGEFYIDGQEILTTTGFTSQSEAGVWLTAGEHTFAWHTHNYPHGTGMFDWPNPTVAAWSLHLAGGIFEDLTPTAVSDLSCKGVFYPAVAPGQTIGAIAEIVLLEAQARGCFPGLTWTFDPVNDSNGVPWPVWTTIATKVGTKILAFFLELAATYMDMRMSPGGEVLELYNFGTMGLASGNIWDANYITALEQSGEA